MIILYCARCGHKREPDTFGPNYCDECGHHPLRYVSFGKGEEHLAELTIKANVQQGAKVP